MSSPPNNIPSPAPPFTRDTATLKVSYDASQDPGKRSSLVMIGWQGRPTLWPALWPERSSSGLRRCRSTNLLYIACYQLPVCSFREHLARAVYEGAVSKRVTLQPIHEPSGRIPQISVHTVDTPDGNLRTIGLTLNVVVGRAAE